jgi:hypothetical protein
MICFSTKLTDFFDSKERPFLINLSQQHQELKETIQE